MQVGLQIAQFNFPGGERAVGPTFAALARAADDGGFASLWVMDHFFQIEVNGPAEQPMLEAYSALSFAAGITKQVKLGAMVTGVPLAGSVSLTISPPLGAPTALKQQVDQQLRLELFFSPDDPPTLPLNLTYQPLDAGRWLVYLERAQAGPVLQQLDMARGHDFRLYSATLEDLYLHYAKPAA